MSIYSVRIRSARYREDALNFTQLTAISTTLALALAFILGAAAPAMAADGDSTRARCISEAARAGVIGGDSNPGNTNFVAGTEGAATFNWRATAGPDVFCGFGGNDFIVNLDAGDAFRGGAGDDVVFYQFYGTFNGGGGTDVLHRQLGGTFDQD